MSIDAVLGGLVKFAWVSDHIRALNDVGPRHLNRPVTFEYFLSNNKDDYSSSKVLGTLEGVHSSYLLVSGDEYEWSNVSNLKVWRSEVRK